MDRPLTRTSGPFLALLVLIIGVACSGAPPVPTDVSPQANAQEAHVGSEQRLRLREFTEAASQIEMQRDAVVQQFSNISPLVLGPSSIDSLLTGYDEWRGLIDLKTELVMLRAPDEMEGVKDLLLEAYALEIDAARHPGGGDMFGSDWEPVNIFPGINCNNVDDYRNSTIWASDWTQAQVLRAHAYELWDEILAGAGVEDPRVPSSRQREQGAIETFDERLFAQAKTLQKLFNKGFETRESGCSRSPRAQTQAAARVLKDQVAEFDEERAPGVREILDLVEEDDRLKDETGERMPEAEFIRRLNEIFHATKAGWRGILEVPTPLPPEGIQVPSGV